MSEINSRAALHLYLFLRCGCMYGPVESGDVDYWLEHAREYVCQFHRHQQNGGQYDYPVASKAKVVQS